MIQAETRADAIVLGAGAAGLLCAFECGRRGRRVVILERNAEPGRKILISGGGRCNFTNIHCGSENFISVNPHFAKSALARYTPADFLELVQKHRIRYHEKKLGQLFCDGSAQQIVAMLLAECGAVNVRIVVNSAIRELRREGEFVVITSAGEFRAPVLVIATGGLSIPKMGATGFGYEVARQFGLRVVPCRPALVPLLFGPEEKQGFGDLAGVSAEVIAAAGGKRFQEKLLFTHRGLSGPAILQVSSYLNPGCAVDIDLMPGSEALPRRLMQRWAATPEALHQWRVVPAGTEGFYKAEVTAGGVDTDELSSKTLEAKRAPGLYFVGEVVDVTGQLGGFNFQWAWASGAAAGRAV